MDDALYIAVDLGAGSGRVFLAGLAPGELLLEEAHRFVSPPRRAEGRLRWDFGAILEEVKVGLGRAAAIARELGRTVRSLGVDSWAVDYGLLDREGRLVEDPICYRDERTSGVADAVFELVPRTELFERTGIQFLPFNTIFQLVAHVRAGIAPEAAALLLIPDLLHHRLTGRRVAEVTNATTTQLVDARTGLWDGELVARLGLPGHLLPEIVPAGTDLGPIEPSLARELGLEGVRVVAPATHDTASAVAGTPLRPGWAYVSSGTWSLVGVERDAASLGAEAERHNFTNEGGAYGTFRFLKNVAGMWILESCRREWAARGLDVEYSRLLEQASRLEQPVALVAPDDPRFFNPPSMLGAIAEQLAESGQTAPDDPASLTRTILDSLALRYASVLRRVEAVTGREIDGVHVVGGASRNAFLDQATATAANKPVLAGPVEATVVGNVLVQAITAGRFASLAEARAHVAETVRLDCYAPDPAGVARGDARRYAELEARYSA